MKRSLFESDAGEFLCAIVVGAGALYLAIHIVAACLRGGFRGVF